MSDPLPVGVVGVGHLGRHHARIWADLPGARLVGVVDTDRERAAEVARAYGTRVLPDCDALAAEARAVSVAVPTVSHASVGCALLQQGVSILVEKPIAPSREEAALLIEEARRARAVLMVGHTERFNPAVRALERRVQLPLFLESHRLGSFSPRSVDIDVVLDLMIHDLDVILSLVDRDLSSIEATGVEALTDKIDIANARLRFEGGAVANVTASRISVERVRKLRIFQPRSYQSLDYSEQTLTSFTLEEEGKGRPAIVREEAPVERGEPLRAELEAFRAAVADDAPVVVPGEQGLRALDAALQVRQRIDESRTALT